MREEFISEQIEPAEDTEWFDEVPAGEPLLPMRFVWRGQEYTVARLLETWKQTGACRSGSSEKYLRKHFYRLETVSGEEMVVYFWRGPLSRAESKRRWWLYLLRRVDSANPGGDSGVAL